MPDLSASQRSKIRRLSQPEEPAPGEEAGELNIVPFLDIIVNILMFVLATVAVTFTTTIETTPPSAGSKEKVALRREVPSLNLTMFITNDGIALKGASGNVAPGCDSIGGGITLPTLGKDPDGQPKLDVEGLQRCVTKIKDRNPDFQEETQIRVTASNNISYRRIIDCIDAVRAKPDGTKLFPDVLFSMPR